MSNAIVLTPRCEVAIRPATQGDYAFVDRLQDMHSKALGFMPKAQLLGKIEAGHILVAEDGARLPIGYCISVDRYYKRDDLGIVYQMNVVPGAQRALQLGEQPGDMRLDGRLAEVQRPGDLRVRLPHGHVP